MAWLYLITIAVLVYIAYQLHYLNQSQKIRTEEEKYKTIMPHLYSKALSEEQIEDIEDFVLRGPHLHSEDMKRMIELETDVSIKERMEKKFKQLGKATANAKKELERTKLNYQEMCYLIDRWYQKHFVDFETLEREVESDDFSDFLLFQDYKKVIPYK